jgi:hypothetical protein
MVLILWALATLAGFVMLVFRSTRACGAILCVAPTGVRRRAPDPAIPCALVRRSW